jgi:hypothetical protein
MQRRIANFIGQNSSVFSEGFMTYLEENEIKSEERTSEELSI